MGPNEQVAWTALFGDLVERGAIEVDTRRRKIRSVTLNPKDNPAVTPDIVDQVAKLLHEKLIASRVRYDAIASIPSGGDLYAEALARCIESVGRGHVRVIRAKERFLEKGDLSKGAKVVLLDDSLVFGGTAVDALRSLSSGGFRAVVGLFVADLEMLGHQVLKRHHDLTVMSVFNPSMMRASNCF